MGTAGGRRLGSPLPGYLQIVDQGDAVLGIGVPCDRGAPATVREALHQLTGVGWVLGDAMLVASELVTNAVVHSGGGPQDVLEVRVGRTDGGLRISVRDPGYSGTEAAVSRNDQLGRGGLGLRVVEAIALRWGRERRSGYVVWAELPLSSQDAG